MPCESKSLGILKLEKEDQYIALIKKIEKETIPIPKFICSKVVNRTYEAYCLLKYPEIIST
jgi:hypothetical protein